jgi:hypothetical protein
MSHGTPHEKQARLFHPPSTVSCFGWRAERQLAEESCQRCKSGRNRLSPQKKNDSGLTISMETCVMSDHQLRFKGPFFEFDAKGWMAILAAIVIVSLVLWLAR